MSGATENPKKRELKGKMGAFTRTYQALRCNGKSQETGIESTNNCRLKLSVTLGATENPKKRELKVVGSITASITWSHGATENPKKRELKDRVPGVYPILPSDLNSVTSDNRYDLRFNIYYPMAHPWAFET